MASKSVGRVVDAKWSEEEQGIDLLLEFEPSGRRLRGLCKAGPDPVTGQNLSTVQLKAGLARIRAMRVYWNPPEGGPGEFDVSRLSRMVVQLDLRGMNLSVREDAPGPDVNTYLSRLFR